MSTTQRFSNERKRGMAALRDVQAADAFGNKVRLTVKAQLTPTHMENDLPTEVFLSLSAGGMRVDTCFSSGNARALANALQAAADAAEQIDVGAAVEVV